MYPTYEEIKNGLNYANSEYYIDAANLNRQIIESILINSELDVQNKKRDDLIEKNLNPPSLVAIFYYYIYRYRTIPTLEQYIDCYWGVNSEWIQTNVPHHLQDAFNGRLARTYPSVLRDCHFYFYLKEKQAFQRVIYKLAYDLSGKVDIFVQTFNGKRFGIQLRLNTANSNYFAKYRKPYRDVIALDFLEAIIDLPLNLSNARSIQTQKNDLKVYSEFEYNELLKQIAEYEKTSKA